MKDKKEPIGQANEEVAGTPKGREAFIAIMKEKNPDYAPENDDQLFDDVHEMHSSMNEELGKHRAANERLAGAAVKDPRVGKMLELIGGEQPTSFPYAHGKVYGKEGMGYEGDELEEFEKGYQENLAQLAQSKALQDEAVKNIEKSMTDLDAYCSKNGIDEVGKAAIQQKGYELADNLLMGIISEKDWELIDKGVNYDQDVQDAADTGLVEGKNQAIDNKKKSLQPEVVPNLGEGTGSGKVKQLNTSKPGSFFNGFPGKR